MDQVSDHLGNIYQLLRIPGDGNCLYGAIAHQLYNLRPRHRLFKVYCRHLREAAVYEIFKNIELYAEHLCSIVDDEELPDAPVVLKIYNYLEKLWFDGVWGGAESIAALCNVFQRSIIIYQDNGKIEFTPTRPENEEHPVIRIFYRALIDGSRTHYDSVLCIRRRD